MSNLIQIKRSTVPGRAPGSSDIQPGELAVNTYDGKLYLKQTVSGIDTVVEVGPVKSVAGRAGNVILSSADVGLVNVENKSSAAIRAELTSANVTIALGYTPYNSTNPSNYLSANQTITLSGDASGSGNSTISVVLTATGVTAGTYKSVTVDTKGRVTAASNPSNLAGYGITDALSTTATLDGGTF